jgi:hypothetical protein
MKNLMKQNYLSFFILICLALLTSASTGPSGCNWNWGDPPGSKNNSSSNSTNSSGDSNNDLNVSGGTNAVESVSCVSAGASQNCTGIHLASADGSGSQSVRGIAFDHLGNMVVTGSFRGSIDFGGGKIESAGEDDIFLAKFDSSGKLVWNKRFGDDNSQYANSVAIDSANNIIITGGFGGSVAFGETSLASKDNIDIFLAKFDPSGNSIWSKSFGDTNVQGGTKVVIDEKDDILLTGGFYNSVDFGNGSLTSAGGLDIFVARFSSSGDNLWSKAFGDSKDQVGVDILNDSSGVITVIGELRSSVDFAGGALNNEGNFNIFTVKITL